jgi:hypothetical protein
MFGLELVVMLAVVGRLKYFVLLVGFGDFVVEMLVVVKLMLVDSIVVVVLIYLNLQNMFIIVYWQLFLL